MIELKNLNKIYPGNPPFEALKNINLRVAPGEIVGVIGKSGAGKSTLIRCVNLLERPTSGSVFVNNVDLTTLTPPSLREARHQIGMIFQHFNLLSSRTAYDNIALPFELLKKSKKEIEKNVSALLKKVGLSQYQHLYPDQLSGGQKQRVAIARALALQPNILLCDEMTSALDPETRDEILALIRSLNQEYHLSILCITHEMHVIKSIADRVAVIDQGEIVECENIVDIFKNPKTDVTKRLLQSVFKSELPTEIQSQLQKEPIDGYVIMRLMFIGHSVLEPIMNEFAKQAELNITVLQANIEQLRTEMLGRMIVAMDLKNNSIDAVKAFLVMKGLTFEVLGYVDRKAWLTR